MQTVIFCREFGEEKRWRSWVGVWTLGSSRSFGPCSLDKKLEQNKGDAKGEEKRGKGSIDQGSWPQLAGDGQPGTDIVWTRWWTQM